jgi:hypothetical protein
LPPLIFAAGNYRDGLLIVNFCSQRSSYIIMGGLGKYLIKVNCQVPH